jgi:hypothetical protein
MSEQPMGISGIDLDIVTGMPRGATTLAEKKAALELKETQAIQEAVHLSQELPLVLPMMARQLENRLIELMKLDERCQGILQMICPFRQKLEVARGVAAKIRRLTMGPVLNSLTDETQVAPERDTDQE